MANTDDLTWEEKLCRTMGLNLMPENVELASEFLDHYQVASGKDLAEQIARTESSEWRKVMQNELVNLHILNNENEENPSKALADIIEWNQKIALDPAVSKDARDLQASRPITLVKIGRHYINPAKVAVLEELATGGTSLLIDGKWYNVVEGLDKVARRLGQVVGGRCGGIDGGLA